MLMSRMLRHLLLAGTCLCVCGNPVHFTPTLQDSSLTTAGSSDVKSEASDGKHVNGPILNVGAEGGAGHKLGPEGIAAVTQAENGDSFGEESGPSLTGGDARSQSGEVKRVESTSEADQENAEEKVSLLTPPGETKQLDMADISTQRLTPYGFAASPQLETPSTSKDLVQEKQNNYSTMLPVDGDSVQERGAETSWLSSSEPPNLSERIQRSTSPGSIPPSVFFSAQTSTPLSVWGHEGATIATLADPLLPEIGPNLMPKEDGLESLWTEAVRPSGADTVVPPSQDEATEGTMSSEALPLIFEPFEDVTSKGAAVTLMPGSTQPPTAMATGGGPLSEVDLEQLVTLETDSDGPSNAPPLLMPDWTSPWQTSGAELLDPVSQSGPSASQLRTGTEPGLLEDDRGTVWTPNRDGDHGPSLSSIMHSSTTVTMATHLPVHKSRLGLEEMEPEEESDDEDDNSEESLEEESEEDLTETPKSSSMQTPYSLIPPPPVWVQRNQGLMRSWVELIREKAGYVSGMLAPVGIGIAGALLIVGALYSIRMIHRKRRNSFKHQRRKVRQPEQPCEPGTSRQDQAMLLADSSEDEF